MNSIKPKQAAIFIAVFFGIALLINSTPGFNTRQEATSAPTSISTVAQQVAQSDANERAQYQARYLNGSFTHLAGKRGVAIVVANEDGKFDSAVNAALKQRLQDPSVLIFPSFFKLEFISDGLFKDALENSSELFQKLDLVNSLNSLILAREDVQYSQSAELENVITATVRLDVTIVPVAGQGNNNTWSFTANGPGFTKQVARVAAEKRLIKQIDTDTNMTLN